MALERDQEPQGLDDLRSRTEDGWERELEGMSGDGGSDEPARETEPEGDAPEGAEPETARDHRAAEDEPKPGESPAGEAGGEDDAPFDEAKYLESYDGDRVKAAKHAIDMRNQNARLTRELKELRSKGRTDEPREVSPRDRAPAAEVPQDVAQLNSALDNMSQSYNASESLLAADKTAYNEILGKIAEIKDEIDDPGPKSEVDQLHYDLKRLEKKANQTLERIRERDQRNQALHDRWFQTKERRDDRLEIHQLRVGDRARTERDQRTAVASERAGIKRDFYAAADRAATQLEMPDNLKAKFLGDKGFARKSALAFLVPDENGVFPEIEDYVAFCLESGKEFLGYGDAGAEARTADYSRRKAADASRGVPSGGAPAKRGKPAGAPPRLPTMDELEEDVSERWDAELATTRRR